MKKNITINLCGRLFQIDEDAYELLQNYIESLRASFGKQEGGEEIADDIEARVAELFDELKANGTEAITIEHVKEIITRIGKPEELAGEDEEAPNGDTQGEQKEGHRYDSFKSAANGFRENVRARTAGKKLYRNPNDKLVAGVLSGFATYTNTDPTWWRIGYALLLLGSNFFLFPLFRLFHIGGFFFSINLSFILFYIAMAIAMPEAKKPRQVLEMEGKDVTPQNLADIVVEDRQQPEPKSHMRGCLSMFLKMLMGLFIAIAAVFGLVLLVCFLLIVGTLIFIFMVPGGNRYGGLPFDLGYLNLAETIYLHPWAVGIFIASLLLALFIPLYAIAHMLLAKSGKAQPMGTAQRIGWIVVWLIALFSIFPSIGVIHNFNEWQRMERQAEESEWMTDVARDYFREHSLRIDRRHHCFDQLVKSGEYFTGDTLVPYIDVEMWGPESERYFQVGSYYAEPVDSGTYRVSCNARADGGGVCLFATAFNDALRAVKVIPASGKEGGLGNGWHAVEVDIDIYGPTTLRYGISAYPVFTDVPCHAKWFSAADFKVERIEEEPQE